MGESIDAIEELKENGAYGVAEGGNLCPEYSFVRDGTAPLALTSKVHYISHWPVLRH